MVRRILPILLVSGSLVLMSCNDESNNLALAQKCLNEVKQTNPPAAMSCLEYVKDMDSQQANILKCGIYMTSGGLMENKIIAAAEALEDTSITNKEAAYMAVLALDMGQTPPDYTAGYDRAVLGNKYCQLSGVPGLRYISSMTVAGSYMARTIDSLGGSLDVSDPTNVQMMVNQLINTCSDPMAPEYTDGTCFPAGDVSALGSTVKTVADAFCSTAPEDDEVCAHVSSAVAAAGSDPADIGRALFCYLATPPVGYNPTTDQCE